MPAIDAWHTLLTAANKEGLIDAIKDKVDIPPESVVENYPQSQWSDYLGELGISLLHRGSILEELRKLAVNKAPPPISDTVVLTQFLHNIKALVKPTRNDAESSFLSDDTWQGNTVIGQVMPFVDRVQEIKSLREVLYLLHTWWQKVGDVPPLQRGESFKEKGFSFIICGAASGIGKSTFARRAFVEMLRLLEASNVGKEPDAAVVLLRDCVKHHALYRTVFTHMQAWERSQPACSIAFRLLHAACKHYFEDKELQFYPHFATSYPPPHNLELGHVFNFIHDLLAIPTTQPLMMVYHLDELNHLKLEGDHQVYMHDVLAHMHASMTRRDAFLVPILTGTNAEELNRLKISSGFPISSINLGPLQLSYMRKILVIVIRKLAQHVKKSLPTAIAEYIRTAAKFTTPFESPELEIMLDDCGGNPQIFVVLVGVLAGTPNILEKMFGISDNQVETLLKRIDELTPTETMGVRDAIWAQLLSSHVLGSLEVSKELAEVIVGYGLTGELVQRSTRLMDGITVGYAESSGALYLLQVAGGSYPVAQYFQVTLPNFHYRTHQFNKSGVSDSPSLSLLKTWTTNSRYNEQQDLEYIAFRVWWLKKQTNVPSFRLSQLFPCLSFSSTQDKELLFPTNFNIRTMSICTKSDYQEQIVKFRTWYHEAHFFLGPGTESFVDSWAVFHLASDPPTNDSPGTAFSLMIQSCHTTVNERSRDCEEQLKMCKTAEPSNFHLLVISDGVIEACESDHLSCVPGTQFEGFFGPVLGRLRKSTIKMLASVGDGVEYYEPQDMEIDKDGGDEDDEDDED